jgi:hypothetical protein
MVNPAIYSVVEINVGIVCASLPTIKPILTKLFPKLLGSSRSNNSAPRIHPTIKLAPIDTTTKTAGGGMSALGEMRTTTTMINTVQEGQRQAKQMNALVIADGEAANKKIFMMTTLEQDVERGDTSSQRSLICH